MPHSARCRNAKPNWRGIPAFGKVGGVEVDFRDGFKNRRSPEYLIIHGLPPEASNESHEDWVNRIHPDDRERTLKHPVGDRNNLVRLPTLRRSRAVQEQITLTGLRRGVLRVGPVSAWRTDPLGLVRWTERWSAASELLVLPRMVAVDALTGGAVRDQEGTPSDEISMSDLAFHALREYVPGDDLRHVHWRSSAKARALQIRQYHDTRRSHLTLVIDDDRGLLRGSRGLRADGLGRRVDGRQGRPGRCRPLVALRRARGHGPWPGRRPGRLLPHRAR